MKSYVILLCSGTLCIFLIHCAPDDTTTVEQINGYNSLVTISEELAGTNCATGGLKITSGLDTNENNVLDAEEISSTSYVCNGTAGTILINTVAETAGTNCVYGGTLIEIGTDLNNNGILDTDEIQSSFFNCSGQDGSKFIAESFDATSCESDGTTYRFGYDNNNDNDLADNEDEVLEEITICDAIGNPDGIYEFYFANGLDGYTGTSDCTINDGNVNENNNDEYLEVVSTANEQVYTKFHSLIHFADVEQIWDEIEAEFDIVEAVVYLRTSGTVANIEEEMENWIGIKPLVSFDGSFDEEAATWTFYDGINRWQSENGFGEDDTNDFSDMFLLPTSASIFFQGIIPLRLDRAVVNSWQDPEANDGFSIELAQHEHTRGTILYSSSFSNDDETDAPDPNFTPMLYIKVQLRSENGRSSSISSDEVYKAQWDAKSYEEKIAPALRVR